MKLVLAVYNMAADEEVMEAVRSAGVEHYTKWPRVLGAGRTGPRLDEHVWPGANCVLLMALPEDGAARVLEALRALGETVGRNEGLRAFVVPIEAAI
ncbi:MAG: PG0541 family transporter-associated protein [Planctomycetota bacterium]